MKVNDNQPKLTQSSLANICKYWDQNTMIESQNLSKLFYDTIIPEIAYKRYSKDREDTFEQYVKNLTETKKIQDLIQDDIDQCVNLLLDLLPNHEIIKNKIIQAVYHPNQPVIIQAARYQTQEEQLAEVRNRIEQLRQDRLERLEVKNIPELEQQKKVEKWVYTQFNKISDVSDNIAEEISRMKATLTKYDIEYHINGLEELKIDIRHIKYIKKIITNAAKNLPLTDDEKRIKYSDTELKKMQERLEEIKLSLKDEQKRAKALEDKKEYFENQSIAKNDPSNIKAAKAARKLQIEKWVDEICSQNIAKKFEKDLKCKIDAILNEHILSNPKELTSQDMEACLEKLYDLKIKKETIAHIITNAIA